MPWDPSGPELEHGTGCLQAFSEVHEATQPGTNLTLKSLFFFTGLGTIPTTECSAPRQEAKTRGAKRAGQRDRVRMEELDLVETEVKSANQKKVGEKNE